MKKDPAPNIALNKRFLNGIMLVTAGALIVLPFYILFFINPTFSGLITQKVMEEASYIAEHLADTLVPEDLLESSKDLPAGFHERIMEHIDILRVFKVRVYSVSGEIIYSTQDGELGRINNKPYFTERVAQGEQYSNVVKKNGLTNEGQVIGLDLVEVYYPIVRDGVVYGTLELYYDVTASVTRQNAALFRIHFILFLVVLFLSVAMVLIYLYASRMIAARNRAHEQVEQARRDWEDTFDTMTDMVTIHDKDFNIIKANKAAKEALNMPDLDLFNKKCYESYHGTEAPPAGCPSCKCLVTAEPATFEIFEPHLDKFLEMRSIPRFDDEENLVGLIHVVRDITERKQLEDSIKESEAQYHALFDNSLNALAYCKIILDENGVPADYRFIDVNKSFQWQQGLRRDNVIGKLASDLESDILGSGLDFLSIMALVAFDGMPQRFEYHIETAGIWYVVSLYCPRKGEFILSLADITDQKNAEKKLESVSTTDELTGLYNRRGFFDIARSQMRHYERSGSPLVVLFADLDGLKWINDNLGHKAGDWALNDAAEILRNTYRETDIVARMGGDEFAVLMVNAEQVDVATLVRRLNMELEKFNQVSERPYQLSISIGAVAHDPKDPLDIEDLLKRADKLMYADKKGKRSKFRSHKLSAVNM